MSNNKREMSSTVSSENPYSRLLALQKMKVVENYEMIRNKTVAIIGVGGVGAVVAEMLCRCGCGKLVLYDLDKVELANMNRMFFRTIHVGLSKVEAAKEALSEINPDVEVETHNNNIAEAKFYDTFLEQLACADLLLCCVDNYAARLVVNRACLERRLCWFESGVAETAVSGHIQLVCPGSSPCYECHAPLVVSTGEPEAKGEGVCAASLPTTNAIISGFMANNALKFLLGFGEVSEYVGYDALRDFFPSVKLKANPECQNDLCRKRQVEHAERVKEIGEERANPLWNEERSKQKKEEKEAAAAEAKSKRMKSNSAFLGISIVSSSSSSSSSSQEQEVEGENQKSGGGGKVERLFQGEDISTRKNKEDFVETSQEESLEDLMKKLKDASSS